MMTSVRALAINCTAKLYAFRKTREGTIVQFVLDPTEVPAKLQTDPIGTSYMMVLVEVDDATGQPKGGDATAERTDNRVDASPRSQPVAGGAHKKSWDELSPAQQAGILCADKAFQLFTGGASEHEAAQFVYERCGVDSRTEITAQNPFALKTWNGIVGAYRTWQREPEYTG